MSSLPSSNCTESQSQPTCSDESWFVATRPIEIPENGYVTNTVVCTPKFEFCFLPPANWSCSVQTNANRLTWIMPDQSAAIHFTFTVQPGGRVTPPRLEDLRLRAQAAAPNSRLVEQFPCYSRTHSGTGFDVEVPARNQFTTMTRFAFIPFEAGLVEFQLATSPAQFVARQLDLGVLLNSFGIAPR